LAHSKQNQERDVDLRFNLILQQAGRNHLMSFIDSLAMKKLRAYTQTGVWKEKTIALLLLWITFSLAASQLAAQNITRLPDAPAASAALPPGDPSIIADDATSGSDATSKGSSASNQPICGILHLGRCLEDLGSDEKGVFTSPFRLRPKDSYWLMPFGAANGLAVAYDTQASKTLGVDQKRTNIADNITNFGSYYATGAESAGVYFVGLARKDPKLAETGRLSAEAILASGTVTLVIKMAANRQRPLQGNGQGDFWADGTSHWEFDSSFPSDHATASMALARVVAGEYPKWYVAIPAYGFAESVGISRILANQHFPSDVLVGQAIGLLTGSYVLHHHALYCCGRRKALTSKILGSIDPIADPRTHAVGVSMEIPFGQ
jgi:membrane-associated phospholipid phosphatase